MELAACISALTNRMPIHMGTDSKSRMDKAMLMMQVATRWNEDSSAMGLAAGWGPMGASMGSVLGKRYACATAHQGRRPC